MTRVWAPIFSSASCRARALITVASIPMWSAVTRSIFWAAAATPRKKLPPPTTTPTCTSARDTSATSTARAFTRPASMPNFSSPAITSPLSFSNTRLYFTWLLVAYFETSEAGHGYVFTQLGDLGLDIFLDREGVFFHERLIVEADLFVGLSKTAFDDLVGHLFRLTF